MCGVVSCVLKVAGVFWVVGYVVSCVLQVAGYVVSCVLQVVCNRKDLSSYNLQLATHNQSIQISGLCFTRMVTVFCQ